MRIDLKKLRDGAALTCARDDGSIATQRTGHRGFFAIHDLMHYAVETTLGFDQAFFGLMAAGWSFETFGDHEDPRSRALPAQAVHAEYLVDLLLRRGGESAARDPELRDLWAEEALAELAAMLEQRSVAPCDVSAEQLLAILDAHDSLLKRWAETPVGGHLTLTFARV